MTRRHPEEEGMKKHFWLVMAVLAIGPTKPDAMDAAKSRPVPSTVAVIVQRIGVSGPIMARPPIKVGDSILYQTESAWCQGECKRLHKLAGAYFKLRESQMPGGWELHFCQEPAAIRYAHVYVLLKHSGAMKSWTQVAVATSMEYELSTGVYDGFFDSLLQAMETPDKRPDGIYPLL